jgi:hypothetical protein
VVSLHETTVRRVHHNAASSSATISRTIGNARLGDVVDGRVAVIVDHRYRLLVLEVVVQELGGDVVLEHLVLEHAEVRLLHRKPRRPFDLLRAGRFVDVDRHPGEPRTPVSARHPQKSAAAAHVSRDRKRRAPRCRGARDRRRYRTER